MRGLTPKKPVEILLVEDNPGDVRLMLEVFKEGGMSHRINVVEDGEEALDFLRKRGRYSDALRPDIILLDLNLPKKDGREVLTEIKQDPKLKRIPVIILTTSNARKDIVKTYDLHANCYITKPTDLNQFIDVVRAIENFWINIVILPTIGGE